MFLHCGGWEPGNISQQDTKILRVICEDIEEIKAGV